MRVRIPAIVAFALSVGAASPLAADSPLSSTDFATAYSELEAVRVARATHRVEGLVLALLLGKQGTDQKAAVVNALGWGDDARGRALTFVEGLAAARGTALDDLRLSQLTAADRFVLGYLLAISLEPGPLKPNSVDLWGATPQALLDQAAVALPNDFTVHYVRGLLEAQTAMDSSWCSAYLATARVLDRFPPVRRNLRAAAVKSAQAYMQGYAKDCTPAPTKAPRPGAQPKRLGAEANQNYALAKLDALVVAGTQIGVVVWDPKRSEPLAYQEEKICGTLVRSGDSVWAGCDGRVLRFDGRTFKSYLPNPAQDAMYYAPFLGSGGALFVRYGARAWEYQPGSDTFAPIDLRLGGEPYDLLERRNGERWWIEFLKSMHAPSGVLALRSQAYPGSDPRTLIEDARGQLWVADFDKGFYRYDDARQVFVHEEPVSSKGVDVAADGSRTFLLHYTDGVVVKPADGATSTIPLGDLEYMRDMLLDEDGSLWVAGWNKLVRLREGPKGWAREAWVAK